MLAPQTSPYSNYTMRVQGAMHPQHTGPGAERVTSASPQRAACRHAQAWLPPELTTTWRSSSLQSFRETARRKSAGEEIIVRTDSIWLHGFRSVQSSSSSLESQLFALQLNDQTCPLLTARPLDAGLHQRDLPWVGVALAPVQRLHLQFMGSGGREVKAW